MLEYQNIKASSSYEEIFVIKKVKNILPLTYVISNLNGEENVYKNWLQKLNQKDFRVEKEKTW